MKKLLFLSLFLGFILTTFAQQRVNGARAIITLHPSEIVMKSKKNNSEYLLLYSLETKSLFITSDRELFEVIKNHLPVTPDKNKSVVVDGAAINLFRIFSKKELKKGSKRLGQNLRYLTAFQITNYGLLGGQSPANNNW